MKIKGVMCRKCCKALNSLIGGHICSCKSPTWRTSARKYKNGK